MLSKKITYEGLQGPVTEEFLFHITPAQILEMNLPYGDDGMSDVLQKIIDTQDNVQIYAEFKKIIFLAVGKRSEDGRRFLKTEEIRQDFENTEAYSELILELMEDVDKASHFIQAIMPSKVRETTPQTVIDQTNAAASVPAGFQEAGVRVVTKQELDEMDKTEAIDGLTNGSLVLDTTK